MDFSARITNGFLHCHNKYAFFEYRKIERLKYNYMLSFLFMWYMTALDEFTLFLSVLMAYDTLTDIADDFLG